MSYNDRPREQDEQLLQREHPNHHGEPPPSYSRDAPRLQSLAWRQANSRLRYLMLRYFLAWDFWLTDLPLIGPPLRRAIAREISVGHLELYDTHLRFIAAHQPDRSVDIALSDITWFKVSNGGLRMRGEGAKLPTLSHLYDRQVSKGRSESMKGRPVAWRRRAYSCLCWVTSST